MLCQIKAISLILGLFLAATLVACNSDSQQGMNDDPGQFLPQSSSSNQATCEADGGTWASGGLHPEKLCFPAYVDAGQSCSTSDQCQGVCLADTNSCASTIMFGCYAFLDDQGTEIMICVD